MTAKDETKDKTKQSKELEKDSMSSKRVSPNLEKLDQLLDAWDDDETSGVHIEELHVHHPTGGYPTHESPTKPFNKVPSVRPSISPKARNITLIIVAVATGLATALKILWETWISLKK